MKRAIAAVPEKDWQGPARLSVLQVAELTVRLPDWSRSRRVVVGRRCLGEVSKEVAGTFWDEAKHEFEAYVTGLPAGEVNAWQVIELYQQRADTENVFDELKHQWGLEGFCCRKRNATALAARLGLLFARGSLSIATTTLQTWRSLSVCPPDRKPLAHRGVWPLAAATTQSLSRPALGSRTEAPLRWAEGAGLAPGLSDVCPDHHPVLRNGLAGSPGAITRHVVQDQLVRHPASFGAF